MSLALALINCMRKELHMGFLPGILVLISLGALLALPVIWLVGRADSPSGATTPHPEPPGDDASSTAPQTRSPLGLIGLAFSVVAATLCFAGSLGFAVIFTSWGESFDTHFYLTFAGAVGLFPAFAGLAYGLVVVVRAKKTGVRDAAGWWAVRLSAGGLLLTGLTMLASLAFSSIG